MTRTWEPGYPVDERGPRVPKLDPSDPVGDFEMRAARVIARSTGVRVVLQDDGSQRSIPDIRIEYTDRPWAQVEVVVDLQREYGAMWREVVRRQQQLPAPDLSRYWWVTTSGTANISTMHRSVFPHLRSLEERALLFEVAVDDEALLRWAADPDVERLLTAGVVGLASRRLKPDELGQVQLIPQGASAGYFLDWDVITNWIDETLASDGIADVRQKLARSGSDERHIFLGVTYSSPGDVFMLLSSLERGLPPEPPALPTEITHLWLFNAQSPDRCLAWFPGIGWFDVASRWATP